MNKITKFIKESVNELKHKVSWTKYSELQSNTVMVIVASFVFAVLVGLVDFVFKEVMTEIYRSF